jgi:hypothetical protein
LGSLQRWGVAGGRKIAQPMLIPALPLAALARLPFFSQRFWRDRAVRLSEAIEIAEVATVISMIF